MNRTIVICANTSWYIYNFRRSTIEMLVDDGWRVIAIAGDDKYMKQLIQLGSEYSKVYLDSTGTNPFKDLLTFFHFYWIYRAKPMVVLNFTPKCNIYSCFAAFIRGIPSINNISGMGRGTLSKGIVGFSLRSLYRLVARIAAITYFQNLEDQKYFLNEFKYPHEKSLLISGSGVNLKHFKYTPLKNNPPIRFGMFTRIIEEKGIRYFIEAARKLKSKSNVEFVIAGSLDKSKNNLIFEEQFRSWIDEGVVKYLGMLSDVREEIEYCDCIVLPSYYPEGTPRILIESAAIGRPIITTDHPGCRDTITTSSGYLVQKKSTSSLISAIESFLKLSNFEKNIMAQKSREHAEKYFDEKIILKSYSETIENVIGLKF